MNISKLSTISVLFFLIISGLLAQQSEYVQLRDEAERFYNEGSYARALEIYRKAGSMQLAEEEKRWVTFRIADTLWRSNAATETSDPALWNQAQASLEEFTKAEKADRIAAEAHESLGDFYWMRRDSRNWGQGWNHYQQALDHWAGSDDIDFARKRYLKIVRNAAVPATPEPYYIYGYYGNYVPVEILENALKISDTQNDRAYMHYLLAMTFRAQGDPQSRALEEFEAALQEGKKTDWYDDALYHYAERLEQSGEFTRALGMYRRITTEFVKGETRYFDQAKSKMEEITRPLVSVTVSNLFLPDSEIQYHLSSRNVPLIKMSLHRVDLLRDVRITSDNTWISQIDLSQAQLLNSWNHETKDQGDHKPKQETLTLQNALKTGAYVIQASAGRAGAPNIEVKDLILVTDATVMTKASGKQLLVYFADARNGSPIPNSKVKIWNRIYESSNYRWVSKEGVTNESGLLAVQTAQSIQHSQFLAVAALGDRQAFTAGYNYAYNTQEPEWRIYAFTDRPAYRPKDEVQWKFIARNYDGSAYSNPANAVLHYEITDPQGAKVSDAAITLNAFGSAWGKLPLTDAMPLGEYRVTFYNQARNKHIGQAMLFRLEEYKLPEFQVSVQTPKENGKTKAFLLGERVQVEIQADYYFGGPVSNATVEVLVYQNPFWHWWRKPEPYSWYYDDMFRPQYMNYGGGQIVKQDTLKTDATGKAILTFETPRNAPQDYEYRIEARVVDASRREITANQNVRAEQSPVPYRGTFDID